MEKYLFIIEPITIDMRGFLSLEICKRLEEDIDGQEDKKISVCDKANGMANLSDLIEYIGMQIG